MKITSLKLAAGLLISVGAAQAAPRDGILSAKPAPSPPIDHHWLPEELAVMGSVVLLPAGTSLQLRLVPLTPRPTRAASPKIPLRGKWSCDYGQITPDGLYTAPRYMPAEGIDTIQYLSPSYQVVRIGVRVLSDPKIPGSDETPYIIAPWAKSQGNPAPPPEHKGPILVLEPGKKPPPLLSVSYRKVIRPSTYRKTKVLFLPASEDGEKSEHRVYVDMEPGMKLMRGKIVPESID